MTGTVINTPAGTPFVEVTREFAATPAQLFRIMTDRDLVADWLGPRDLDATIEEYDVRPGGTYRYIHRDDSGEYAFRGVFHSVEQDKLIIQTFEWEGAPGQVCIEKMTLEPTDSGVRLHQQSVFPSVDARDQSIEYGMESGINDSMDRLAELLAKES
ncbi:SRPBCC domain-containing protein [Kribbella sp. NPDC058693]|uniref:Polyketide cyclase n=1 Tax=Kribbella jiaozuonensis TaxID=2575441 RepID=A0A4V5UVT8_9ACTN|nr:SRPBCC domain-containing protein [Kribbella jiaozuonensis]TKK74343.1 polyketide cyclase [Kribbella jiaozuonensis]